MSPEKNKNRRTLRTCGLIFLAIALISCCCLVVVGGFFAYQYYSGNLSWNNMLNILNLGPGEIQLTNLSDGPIEADLRSISEEDGSSSHFESKSMEPFDMAAINSISSGKYILTLTVPNGLPPSDSCRLTIRGGDFYHIAVVPEGILIALEGKKISSVADINMATSPLCER